jgi:hypothetical protein
MANMQIRINEFIASHELDESITDSLIDLINGCFSDYVAHMSKEWLTANVPAKTTKKAAASKTEKLETAADAESLEQLKSNACTSVILNDYCREHGLRIGGTKKEIAERVWRHLQGEQNDEDTSPRSKPKKVPAKKEQHQCFACNAKGQPCGNAGTEQHSGEWFCFRHIDSAEEIIEKKNAPSPAPKAKASPKAEPKSKTVSKRPSAGALSKKAKAPVESEPESEEELEEDDN